MKVNAKKLKEALERHLDDLRAKEKAMCEELELKYRDPLADTVVRADADCIKLVFDGAGYDYFSYNADENYDCLLADAAEEFGFDLSKARKNRTSPRDKLDELAKEHGFLMEDINSYSLGFYDEAA